MNLIKQKFWLEHFNAWRESGLSHNEYCLKQGINIKLFSSWKTRLYKENPSLKTSISTNSPTFVSLSLAQEDHDSNESGISIQFANDLKISLAKNFDANTLSRAVSLIAKKNV